MIDAIFPTFMLMDPTGKLKPTKMITSRIPIEDLVEGGIKALINDKESHVKILVEVGGMSRVDSAVH